MSTGDAAIFISRLLGLRISGNGPVRVVVTCKDNSMYGVAMCDLHLAGVRVKSDLIVRFRNDGKVALGDLMAATGVSPTFGHGQTKIRLFDDRFDDTLDGLDSIEYDNDLAASVYL